jgi:hypothetical protein
MNDQNSQIDNIIKNTNGALSRSALEKAQKTGDASSLINSLSNDDKQKLNRILSDKEELEKLLKSPQAQMLLKLFSGGKNG